MAQHRPAPKCPYCRGAERRCDKHKEVGCEARLLHRFVATAPSLVVSNACSPLPSNSPRCPAITASFPNYWAKPFAGEFGNPPRVPITTMQGERPRATRPSAAAGARSARGTPRPHAPRPSERSLTGPLTSPASAQSPSPAPAQPIAPARCPSQATDSPPWSRLARGSTWRPRCVGNSRR